jgi:Sigma-70, region 4
LRAAPAQLPNDQRDALTPDGAAGFSYGDAATVYGCAVDTIKSRVSRASLAETAIVSIDGVDDFGLDVTTRAVFAGGTSGWHGRAITRRTRT